MIRQVWNRQGRLKNGKAILYTFTLLEQLSRDAWKTRLLRAAEDSDLLHLLQQIQGGLQVILRIGLPLASTGCRGICRPTAHTGLFDGHES